MKLIIAGAALILAGTLTASAAEPAKMMDTSIGKIMVTEKGMTLYTFDKDTTDKSNCSGNCIKMWPPLKADAKSAPMGEWTLVKRDDGTEMWAYKGKPLYLYANDKKTGDVKGDGVNGVWHAVK